MPLERKKGISAATNPRLNNIPRSVLHPLLRELKILIAGGRAFRQNCCSCLVEQDVPIPVIKKWIRHRSEKMNMLYAYHRIKFHSAILAQLPSACYAQKENKISLLIPDSPKTKPNLTEGEESRKL